MLEPGSANEKPREKWIAEENKERPKLLFVPSLTTKSFEISIKKEVLTDFVGTSFPILSRSGKDFIIN